jgi:glycylpeptide N-tetradecanoyltransferase
MSADESKEPSSSSSSSSDQLDMGMNVDELAPLIEPEEAEKLLKKTLGQSYVEKLDASHKFWDEQPVSKLGEKVELGVNEPIDEPKTVDDVPAEPYSLGDTFEWYDIDIGDEQESAAIYKLLAQNYVEDDDNYFRFDYSIDFLRWALTPPHFRKDWHCAVRVKKSKAFVGFISAVPATMRVYGKEVQMVEINFLCVHKKLRDKRLAPMMIKEITRRVNRRNLWQAIYTAGVVLPNPVASCSYYHRSLNPKKLVDVRFSQLRRNQKMSMLQRLFRLPAETQTPGMRPMEPRDVPAAAALLKDYLRSFHIAISFTEEEFAHWLLPRDNVIYTYVVENPKSGQVTDMVSFYSLPSTIIGNAKHRTLFAAYSFYNVSTKTPYKALLQDALILAKSLRFDVFNALDILDNEPHFEDLRFKPGDGHLQFYIYNWKCPATIPGRIGIVML